MGVGPQVSQRVSHEAHLAEPSCLMLPEPRTVLVAGISGHTWLRVLGTAPDPRLSCLAPPTPHVFVNTLASFGPTKVFKCVIYFSNHDNCYKIKV